MEMSEWASVKEKKKKEKEEKKRGFISLTSWLHVAHMLPTPAWRGFCGSLRHSSASKSLSDFAAFILDAATRCGTTFSLRPAQPTPVFSVLLQWLLLLPAPTTPALSLQQQQHKVCPSEVLCAIPTAVNAQNFMLHFVGKEIPQPFKPVRSPFSFTRLKLVPFICTLLEGSHPKPETLLKLFFCYFSGSHMLFFNLITVIPVIKLRLLDEVCLMKIMWGLKLLATNKMSLEAKLQASTRPCVHGRLWPPSHSWEEVGGSLSGRGTERKTRWPQGLSLSFALWAPRAGPESLHSSCGW